MSRSVLSVRSSDPWLRRTDRLPLAQCRGLLPGEGKVGQHFFRVLSPGLAAQMHRLFCISRNCSAFLMERSHPRAPLTKCLLILRSCLVKIAHFANHLWSLRAEQCIWEKVLGASGRLRFMLRNLQQMLEPLPPAMVGFATHRTASLENTRCCPGWLLLLPQRV